MPAHSGGEPITEPCRARIGGTARAVAIAGVVLRGLSGAASAQTLDEQYELFLAQGAQRCNNLAFERIEFDLVPGQAGPNLTAFCSGPPVALDPGPGGSVSTSSIGGAAGAAAGRGGGAAQDAALRRRRARARDEDAEGPAPTAGELDIVRMGRLGVFFSLDYQYERQRVSRFEAERRSDLLGAALGMDYRFGATAVGGLALKYSDLTGKFAAGGDFDTRSRGAWLYASWFPRAGTFLDLSAGIEASDLDVRRIVARRIVTVFPDRTLVSFNPPPRPVESAFGGRARSAELRAGHDFMLRGMALGPRAALVARRTHIDGFVERGETPMTLAFDAQTERSLRTALGFQGSRAFSAWSGALVAQLNVDWLHELEDDQRLISARFAEDLHPNAPRLRFQNEAPDRDWYVIRASAVAVFPYGLSLFLSLESTVGHAWLERHGASVGLRRER